MLRVSLANILFVDKASSEKKHFQFVLIQLYKYEVKEIIFQMLYKFKIEHN